MINCLKIFLLITLFSTTVIDSQGQIDDTRSRHRFGINYDINKKVTLYAGFRIDTEYNLSTFRKSNFDLEIDYRISKNLELIGMYRFSTSYDRDYHRMRVGMKYYYTPLKSWTISLRSMVQHDIDYWDKDYLQSYNPRWVWRNKVSIQYDLNKKMDIAIYDEIFANRYKMINSFYRNRLGIDFSYNNNKRHKISIGYFLQHNFNVKNPSLTQSFYTNYTYNLKKFKKKPKVDKIRIRN